MIKRSMLALMLAVVGTAGCVSAKPDCPRDKSMMTKKMVVRGECRCTGPTPFCPVMGEYKSSDHERGPTSTDTPPAPPSITGKP